MLVENTIDDFDTGVSPVVGVILMVAVTVILAAVIGTFVLDLGGNVSQNAQAGVTFDEDAGTSLTVQLNSVQSGDSFKVQSPGGSEASFSGVGSTVEASGSGALSYSAGTYTVIGTLDGEENVIQTYDAEG